MATKKKVRDVGAEALAAMHPDIPFDDGPDAKAAAEKAATAAQPDLATLLAKIETMGGELTRLQQTNSALMAQPSVQVRPQLSTEPNMKDLPDPTLEPENFGSELQKRLMTAIQNHEALAQFDAAQNAKAVSSTQMLWEQFQKDYPDYATNKDVAEFAATKVVERAAARNIDTNKYMFANSGQFMKDVVAYMDETFKIGEKETETPEPEPENRTVGIFGGMESGGKPVEAQADPRANDMFNDIRDWQMKSGFHR